MELARAFFTPLGAHLRSALAELPDADLKAAHRVLTAMTAAMSAFESELVAQQAELPTPPGRRKDRSRQNAEPV